MDAPDPGKAGFIVEAWHYVTAALAAVVAYLAKDTMARLKYLESSSLTKADFEKAMEEAAIATSKARHDFRNDLQVVVNTIALDREHLRTDLGKINDSIRVMGEDVALIKGQMK